MKHILLLFLSFHAMQSKLNAQKMHHSTADSLLLVASLHGNVQEIKAAIRLGADVNAINDHGDSPLNMVSKLSYEFLVSYLIDLTKRQEHVRLYRLLIRKRFQKGRVN